MRHHQQGGGGVPLPELLVAYADGQLDPQAQRHVEAWLARHPDVAAEVEWHRRLAKCWNETQACAPDPKRWAPVLAGIKAELHGPRLPRARWRRPFMMLCTPLGGIAAAIVLLIVVPRSTDRRVVNPTPAKASEDLIFVADGDVQLEKIQADSDGMLPIFRQGAGSGPPMMIALPTETGTRAPKRP